MLSDQELVKSYLKGNQAAFNLLVTRYQDYIYTVCFNILKNKPEAQEAAQDTFVKTYKALNKYKDESKLSSWLYKIAYRTCLDKIRSRKKTIDLDEVGYAIPSIELTSGEQLEKNELNEQLAKAILKLDPKEAGLIRMFYLEEMAVKELAQITGISLSNVKVLLFRARKKLAKIVEEDFIEVKNYLTS